MFKLIKHFNRIRGSGEHNDELDTSNRRSSSSFFQIFNFSVEMGHMSTLWRIGLITFVNTLGLDGKIDTIM